MCRSKTKNFILFCLLICFVIACNKDNKTNTPKLNSTTPVNLLITEADNLANKQDYSHAVDKYYEALKTDPNCFLCYYKLAQVYWLVRDYESAVSCLEAATRLNPRWSLPYETLGDIYLKTKLAFPNRLEKAAENYKKAIALEPFPHNIELHFKLAETYEADGDEKNAENEYEKILKIDSTNSTAARTLEKLRNKADSK